MEFNKEVKGISVKAMRSLMNYPMLGNVRELKNIIRNAALLTDKNYIENIDLAEDVISNLDKIEFLSHIDKGNSLPEITQKAIQKIEKGVIETVLTKTKNNKSMAAKILQIDRTTLYSKIKLLGL